MKKLSLVICLLAFVSIVSASSSTGSPGQKNANGSFVAPGQAIPLRTLWKYNLGKNKAVPELVFTGGLIYWGDVDGKFHSMDAKSGKIKFEFQTGGPIYEKPLISRDMAYFCSYDGELHALNLTTGTEKWKYTAGNELRCVPFLMDNLVIILYKKEFIALDLETGLEMWKKSCVTINYLQFVRNDSVLYFSDNRQIVAVDIKGCKNIWQYEPQVFGMSKMQYGFGNLYYTGPDGVMAIKSKFGKPIWKFGFDKANTPKNYTNLYLYDSALYAPVDFTLYVFNAVNGKILWGYKSKLKKDIDNVSVDGDRTYFTESTDIIYMISRKDVKKIDAYKAEAPVNSQLFVDNTVGYFVSADGTLYSVKFP